jgi:zinc transport system substrate-binding protein
MVAISKAKLYFVVGVEFEEANLDRVVSANPKLKVVRTDHGIEKIPMDFHRQPYHKAKAHRKIEALEGDHHEHGNLDPHIWLSPPLVKVQSRNILEALQEIDPSHQNDYEANYHQFVSQLDKLDADLKETFRGQQGLQFLVFHPSWGYFARTYGLKQVPIEIEGKNPKPFHLKDLIEGARDKGIKVVFVQPQYSVKSAEVVAKEIGGQVVFANPLAGDWMENLLEMATQFKAALK